MEPMYAELLTQLVIDRLPINIVEIGTGQGYSTAHLLLGVNQNKEGTVYTFDPVQRKPYVWRESGISDERLRKFNSQFLESKKVIPNEIDFLLHDAGHFFEHVKEDIGMVLDRMTEDSIICVHDIMYSYDMGEKLKLWFESMPEWSYEEKKDGCGLGIARRRPQ